MSHKWAIIFDVDGVLLELTRQEEELFFEPFASRVDAANLSRDWNSYKIRNDEEIVAEIVTRHGLPSTQNRIIIDEYLALLEQRLATHELLSQTIQGAHELLNKLSPRAQLGIATANFRRAAQLRLSQVGLWSQVQSHAFGADGGGHKSEILARAIKTAKLDPRHTIFIGDNVNDVIAGRENEVHFIGFSQSSDRREQLARAGATSLSATHNITEFLVMSLLNP